MGRKKKGQSNKPKDGQDPKSKSQDAKPSREEPKKQTSAEQQPGPSGQQKHVKGPEGQPAGPSTQQEPQRVSTEQKGGAGFGRGTSSSQQVGQPSLPQKEIQPSQPPQAWGKSQTPSGAQQQTLTEAQYYCDAGDGRTSRPSSLQVGQVFSQAKEQITSHETSRQTQPTNPSGRGSGRGQPSLPQTRSGRGQSSLPQTGRGRSQPSLPQTGSGRGQPSLPQPGIQPTQSPSVWGKSQTPTGVQPQTPIGGMQPSQPPSAWWSSQPPTGVQPQTPIGGIQPSQQPPSVWGRQQTPTGVQPQTPIGGVQPSQQPPPMWGQQQTPTGIQPQTPIGGIQPSQQPPSVWGRQQIPTGVQPQTPIGGVQPSQQPPPMWGQQQTPTGVQPQTPIGGVQPSQQPPPMWGQQQTPTGAQPQTPIGGSVGYGRGKPPRQPSQQKEIQPSQPPKALAKPQTPTGAQPQTQKKGQQMQRQGVSSQQSQATGSQPSEQVSTEEDKQLLQSFKTLPLRSTKKRDKKQIQVIVNYFPLNTDKLDTAFQYDVTIVPDKPKKVLLEVMDVLRKKRYSDRHPAYDGNKNLYSSKPLFESSELVDTIPITLESGIKEYKVTIKLVSELDLKVLRNSVTYAQESNILYSNHPAAPLQCLNVILSNVPALTYMRVGRSHFSEPSVQFKLGDGCVLYHGFSQAAILRWKPFINLDVAYKAITETKPMVGLLQEMFPYANLNQGLKDFEATRFANYIRRLQIMYEAPNLKRKYIVNDIYSTARKARFNIESGEPMTVEHYFKLKKNVTLKYPNLPTLWVGNQSRQNKIWLPLELCTLIAGQPVSRNMTDNQIRNMIKEVSKNTKDRLDKIQGSVDSLKYNINPVMKEFGLSVQTTPQEVTGKILESPYLKYKTNSRPVRKGVWTPGIFQAGANISNWTIFCLDERTRDETLFDLSKQLILNGRELGLLLANPTPQFIRLRNTADLKGNLAGSKYQLVVVILNNREDCYNEVKRTSELLTGYVTQCVKARTLQSMQKATICNILLKINAKLNGLSHCITTFPKALQAPTMIMGADVTHPGSSNFPSIAAVTASYDVQFLKYRFEWRLQPPRQEMITDLKEITKQHLTYYYQKNNGQRPQLLLYIRDGVSDGQFIEVLNVELQAIRAACSQIQASYKPAIVFIVVQKRHRTRFFPKDPSMSEDRNFNVPAGTCIDTVITHPTIIDFYLVSHASIKGVARPTKYVQLWSDIDLSEEDLEQIMYYLCHLYVRCNRSVSYPAPTYYAHHAAARAKAYCDRNIDTTRLADIQNNLQIRENILKNSPMFFI